jgi:hypothetical protein
MHGTLNVKFRQYFGMLMGPIHFQVCLEKLDALAALPPTRKHRISLE